MGKHRASPSRRLAASGGPCHPVVDVDVICAGESERVAGLLRKPHERCISPGSSRGETSLISAQQIQILAYLQIQM